ncbi:MAG: efflux RND transporter permease subunit [Desulfobacter sp.]
MNLATFAIEKKVVTIVLTLVLLGGGITAFLDLSMLEDPEYTIKEALVVTPYPGASALEVEQEVTDLLEQAVQNMGQLDRVTSRSVPGMSVLTVTIKNFYDKTTLPQVWDELRRKIGDAGIMLPPGAGPPMVLDDYGDVYGIFLAITGDEYTHAELKEFVKMLRRELLLVKDVAKIETFGMKTEAIFIELDRDRMAQAGIPETLIHQALQNKNMVADAGRVRVGPESIRMESTGTFTRADQFENLLIPVPGSQKQVFLRDIARISREYAEPDTALLNYDGRAGIGLGISTVSGGNAVDMGLAVKEKLAGLAGQTPMGITISPVSFQSDSVTTAIKGFLINLAEAVAIVIVVLMIFMGFRSACIIGFILVVTIFATFILMKFNLVALERVSLGALIIALGMLVDNAIVVIDGMAVKMKQGIKAKDAAASVVKQTALPLLGATAVAILAFAAIGTSKDDTGEFCRSLYQVILYSLSMSWVTAVTITPLLGVMFLKPPAQQQPKTDPYDTRFFRAYKSVLKTCIRFKWVTTLVVLGLFMASLAGFTQVTQTFFPPSTRPQFMVGCWLPQGTHINETRDQAAEIESYLMNRADVAHVTTLVGQGGLRFLLTYTPELENSAYFQFLVDVKDYRTIDPMMAEIDDYIFQNFADIQTKIEKFSVGPGGTKVELRIQGPDTDELRRLSTKVLNMMADTGHATAMGTDWEQRVKKIRVNLAETQANLNGISRVDVANVLKQSFETGRNVGLFRDGDEMVPIFIRAEKTDRMNVESIKNLQIWSPAAERMIPLRQVVQGFDTVYEDDVIRRRNRMRTLTVKCEPRFGIMASTLQAELMAPVAGLDLPPGYRVEWGGEMESSADAQEPLLKALPMVFLVMFLVVVALFNAIRQPLIIFLCVPLALVGVTAGLLVFDQPFGFMAILGFLSLSGMLIKNAIVLIDEINLQIRQGKEKLSAVLASGASRLIPVGMAASTTALGMIPLVMDAFFASMAVTIICGLVFASVLTMIFIPVLYTIFFKIDAKGQI